MNDKVYSSRAPKPVGPYPHARRVGDFIFVSGMGPRQPGSDEIPQGITAQTQATIRNIQVVLEDMGASLKDVVDVQVFLTNMKSDFAEFNKVYGEHFAAIGPTRTTVEVTALPTPISVELKVIAHKPVK